MENIGKRLVNSREGKVEFDKPPVSRAPNTVAFHQGQAEEQSV